MERETVFEALLHKKVHVILLHRKYTCTQPQYKGICHGLK